MSIRAIAKVWDYEGIDPRNKFILIAYADHADHDGRNVYPAVATVAEKTCYSGRTVQRATRELEEAGLLIPDGKGPSGTNKWRVNMHWGVTSCQGDNLSGVTTGPFRGDRVVTQTVLEPIPISTNVEIGAAYACPTCGKLCKSKGGLTNHRTRMHGRLAPETALDVFQAATGYRPVPGVRERIIAVVTDMDLWDKVVRAYCGQGWNPRNAYNMLEFYQRREIPGGNGDGRNTQHRGRGARGAGSTRAAPSGKEAGKLADPYGERWERISRENAAKSA